MFSTEDPDVLKSINANLVIIRKILEIQTRDAMTRELNKLASTSERRKMWILSTGELSTEQIASKAGLKSDRSVQYFTKDAAKAGLLAFKKRGYPIRLIDFIPSEWEESESLDKDIKEGGKPVVPSEPLLGASDSQIPQSSPSSTAQGAERLEST